MQVGKIGARAFGNGQGMAAEVEMRPLVIRSHVQVQEADRQIVPEFQRVVPGRVERESVRTCRLVHDDHPRLLGLADGGRVGGDDVRLPVPDVRPVLAVTLPRPHRAAGSVGVGAHRPGSNEEEQDGRQ